jgi:hypothetical protein
MGYGHAIYNGAKKVFSFLLGKAFSALLFFFVLGMLYAYYLIEVGATPMWIFGFALGVPVMWHDLDDGVAFFLLVVAASIILPTPVL